MKARQEDVHTHTSVVTCGDGSKRTLVHICWVEEDDNTTKPVAGQLTVPYDVLVAAVFSDAFKQRSEQGAD